MPREKVKVFGVDVEDIPSKWQAIEVVVLVKTLDADGDVSLCLRYSKPLTTWETIGMLRVAEQSAMKDLLEEMEDESDIEDEGS